MIIKFITFIFVIILLLFVFGVAFISKIISFFVRGTQSTYNEKKHNNYKKSEEDDLSESKKIFSKDEGEYVDFEEIKK